MEAALEGPRGPDHEVEAAYGPERRVEAALEDPRGPDHQVEAAQTQRLAAVSRLSQ